MTVLDEVRDRKIREVVHFTTNSGLLGILATGKVLSRGRLPETDLLEYVYSPNAKYRKDTDYLDYINLSISQINHQFFEICSERWYAKTDTWWCILSFDARILADEGVLFTTTNNIYSSVRRGEGQTGLRMLFQKVIDDYPGKRVTRNRSLPMCRPTNPQAEVLYPGELSIAGNLQAVYFATQEHLDLGRAQARTLDSEIPDSMFQLDGSRFTQ